MLTNKTRGNFRQEWCSQQPAGCRELDQQCIDKTRPIVALIHGETFLRVTPADEQRL